MERKPVEQTAGPPARHAMSVAPGTLTRMSQPIRVPFSMWKTLLAATLYLWIPGLTLAGVLLLRPMGPGFAGGIALVLVAIGTTVQTRIEMLRAAERIAAHPPIAPALVREVQPNAWVWGLMATAAWTALFAHTLR